MTITNETNILRISSSANQADASGHKLADQLLARLTAGATPTVVDRDLALGVPQLDQTTLNAIFAPAEERTEDQQHLLVPGQTLIDELKAADVVVISMPIYNFGPPATLKAWTDLVVRAGETFKYAETGPVPLLDDKQVYLVVTSGGVPIGSPVDFASGWMKFVLQFMGITSVEVVGATGFGADPEAALATGMESVDNVALPGAS